MPPPAFGHCAVCGEIRRLTNEHVPAKALGNRGEQVVYRFDHVVNRTAPLLPEVARKSVVLQVLCAPCNSDTGSLYVPRMKTFMDQAGTALDRIFRPVEAAAGITKPELRTVDFHIEPLGVLKYVVTLMLVTCTSGWSPSEHPDLRRFVMDREAKGLPPRYRFYAGLLYGPLGRISGLAHSIHVETGRIVGIAEVSFPPVAFLMTFDQPPAEATWPGEITHLTGGDYVWKEPRDVRIEMTTGFTSSDSMIPGMHPSPARDIEARMDAFLNLDP